MTEYEKMTGEGSMNENKLREYAKLIVKIGANVQKGQRVPSAGRRRSDSAGKDGD